MGYIRLSTIEQLDPEEEAQPWILENASPVFELLTKGEDTLKRDRLKEVLRELGMAPTDTEIMDVYSHLDIRDTPAGIDMNSFAKLLCQPMNQDCVNDTIQELSMLFTHLSKGRNTVTTQRVQQFLSVLDEDDAAAIFKEISADQEELTLDRFLGFMIK